MDTTTRNRRAALAIAIGTPLFLLWAIGALGVIGAEGDPADLMYLGVIGVAVGGYVVARLRPDGMVRACFTAAAATGLVAVVALLAGEHEAPATSVLEILGLNAMFAGMFVAAALLFRRADRSA